MVRPIDVQQVIIQSNPVEKIQQTQQRHPDMQQRYFDIELQKERASNKEKIKESQRIEQQPIKDDEKRQGWRGDEGGAQMKREGHEEQGQQEETTDKQGRYVDVKV